MTTPRSSGRRPEVLLVEDRPSDARLLQEAFRTVNKSARVHLVTDGSTAMAFLKQAGKRENTPRPDVILLCLGLPNTNGHTVLAHVKRDGRLKAIPTIVLSSSDLEVDILASYQLQANCHLRKPTDWDALNNLVESINAFWLKNTKLPRPAPSN